MNYYERYCGDYARDTAHLELGDHGAYTLMLDTYYSTEKPLPAAYEPLYRICRAMSKLEQASVRKVADEFFPVGADGLRHNKRADADIADAQPRIAAARANGGKGGRPRKKPKTNPDETQPKPSGLPLANPAETQSGEASPNATHQHSPNEKENAVGRVRGKKPPLVPLPPDFAISDRVRSWAERKGFDRLEERLEHFVGRARARAYTYADWDDAFIEAIRKDWAGLGARQAPAGRRVAL